MFGGREKERHFDRTEVSTTESVLSWGVLGVLASVGALVAALGNEVDTGLFTASVAGTSETRIVESTTPTPTAEPASEPQSAGAIAFDGIAPAGWSMYGSRESFTAETLYEKINGRAEQYLAYDVSTLECASYTGENGQYVDVYLYDMQSPLNAYGIYSVERSPDGEPLSLADRSYRSGTGIFFWQGGHYGQVIGSDGAAAVAETVEHVASRLAQNLPAASTQPWGLRLLPDEGLLPGSTQFYKKDALGLDFLPETFLGRYSTPDGLISLFMSRAESEARASEVLISYKEYAEMFGQSPTESDRIWVCDLGGVFDAVFTHGPFIGGTTSVPDPSIAIARARALLEHLEASP